MRIMKYILTKNFGKIRQVFIKAKALPVRIGLLSFCRTMVTLCHSVI
jgi:hypothetical protein